MWNSGDIRTSRRSTRLAVIPPPVRRAAVVDEDDEDSVDIDVAPKRTHAGHRKYDPEEEEYDSKELSGRRKKGSGGRQKADGTEGKQQRKKGPVHDTVLLPRDEMLQNCLLYLLLLQHKKIPAKKADIVKHAMNGQTREFEELFKDLSSILNHIFGMKVIGVGETQKSGLYSNYILISNYNLSVCDMVTPRDHDVDSRRSILFLILTVIFMLNRSIDEELIWKVMDDTKLNSLVCEKRDSLRRFLKQEYVSTLYLDLEENNDSDPPIIRYAWGLRADKEFSKYSILKFVTKQFPGKKPIDFTIQYGIAKDTEGELVAQDAAIEAREAEEGLENVPVVEGYFGEDEDELLSQPFRLGDVNSDDEDDVLPVLPGESQETDEMDSDQEER